MKFAFLDESGDDGGKGSNVLVLTLCITSEKKKIEKIIRNTKQRLLEKNKTSKWYNRMGEIKFYSFPDKNLLERTLKKLSKIEMELHYIIINKSGKNIEKNVKENIIFKLFEYIMENNQTKPIMVCDLSFFKEKTNRFRLNQYKSKKDGKLDIMTYSRINDDEVYKKLKDNTKEIIIDIKQKRSKLNDCLQAVDLLSGAIWKKFEYGEDKYWKILFKEKSKIKSSEIILHKI